MSVIEEIRAGNKETIKTVYKENVKDVYNFAKSITGNHDTALDATKKTFVILFNRIQKGEEPTNIRLAALKIAYDEACAIAMPSTEAIDSPYDKSANKEEVSFKVNSEPKAQPQVQPQADSPAKQSADASVKEEPVKQDVKEEPALKQDKKLRKVYEEPEPSDENLFRDAADADEDGYDVYEKKAEKKKHPVVSVILLIINIILILILAWFILGLLQNMEIIPENINMGHEWFNNNIYPLF